jgi:O-antigen/teichoic acid export membrane protein
MGYAWQLYSFDVFLLLFVVINCSVALILLVYIIWLRQFFIRPQLAALKEKPLAQMVQYGSYSFLGNVSSTIIMSIDSVMIGHYTGLGDVGIYTTAAYIASVILIPGRSLYKIALPQIADFWKTENRIGLAKLYKQVTRVNLVIGCLLFIGIWVNIDNMFALLPAKYSQGRFVIIFIGLARLFDLATGINGHILLTSSRYRYDLLFNVVLSLITIFTNFYFIPAYGINGAAFAAMLAYVLINFLRLVFVWLWFRMQPFDQTTLQILALATISYGLGLAVPQLPNTFLDIAVRSSLLTCLYAAGIWWQNLAPEVTQKMKGFLVQKRG